MFLRHWFARPASAAARQSRPVLFETVESRLLMSSGPSTPSPVVTATAPAMTASLGGTDGGTRSSGSTASAPIVHSGDKAPLFDFSDAFYRQNGIDPTKIAGRPGGAAAGSVVDTTTDPTRRNVRLTGIVGGHDDNGKPILFGILGTVQANAFTNDAAGRAARQIADKYVAYIFPKAGSNPLSPAQKRQDELIPLNDGYFSNDPTNIWREAFVNYVPAALSTAAGRKAAQDLLARNGPDADGTPMIRTLGDLQKARQAGIVTVTRRADDGSQGAPWFFCAVYKDPRGAVPADTTLTVVRNADGTTAATSRDIEDLFNSVKAK